MIRSILKFGGRVALAALFAALPITFLASPASGHEQRTVGPFSFVVGWGDEPAYAGSKNSAQLILSEAGKPVVEGVDVDVEVAFGTQTMKLTMGPYFEVGEFGTPGDYRAFLFPTRPGSYTFHLTGTIKGTEIDEEFTSGPKTFSDIEDPASISFPVRDPSAAQLAERLDRETARIQASAYDAEDNADSAKTLGYVGIALGAVALASALALGLRRGRG